MGARSVKPIVALSLVAILMAGKGRGVPSDKGKNITVVTYGASLTGASC